MTPSRLSLAVALPLLFAGCVTSLEVHPKSPTPKRWASDPRTRGMGALRIIYSTSEPSERVTATISSRADARHRFTAHGRWWWDASPEVVARTPAAKLVQVYEFDGVRERYKTVYERTTDNPQGTPYLWLLPR